MTDISLLLQVECTYFFEENPFAMETLESLASRLGRSTEHLKPIINSLVALSILTEIESGNDSIYRYNQPNILSEKLDDKWKTH
ncbi:hypothetical protein PU629_20630 [Pullulanibacillus sp. KACC 23026]|uniref:hypothetical protein n=1 Tax=Pullulanibacillus sp. KACC 23026 TaxID=3028315 RepID=UPI0023B132D0|nr:hypothetical protein [Pullulanibacillus sp. KACC 23026]WEG12475.1 hypothetical protein PU629_20630 [Pullulanibacillus sp. KACC 23026]